MIGNSLYPLSKRPRRSSRASTLKSSRPNPRLIATSHKLAALKRSSLSGLSIKVRACFESRLGSPAAHRRRCVSSSSFMHHRRRFARSPPCHAVKVVRHRDLPRHETEPPYLITSGSAKGSDFHDGLTGLGNNERLTLRGLFYEF